MLPGMNANVIPLTTARSLTSARPRPTIDVARLTDSRSYARGVEYLRAGRVRIVRRTSSSVVAAVTGTRSYEVRLANRPRGLDFSCTCPVGTEGAFCKHLVAVALLADDAPPVDRPREPTAGELRDWLATVPHDELVELVMTAAANDMSVHHLLLRHHDRATSRGGTRPVDLDAYRRAIGARLDPQVLDHGPACCWARRAHEVIDDVEALLDDGRAADVVEFCEFAVHCLEEHAPSIDDADDELRGLAARLGDLHLQACQVTAPEPVTLARRLFDSELNDDLGAYAGAPERYAGVLGRTGLDEYQLLTDRAWNSRRRQSDVARAVERFRLEPIRQSLRRARQPGSLVSSVPVE
jgi:hypothetical protein